MSKLNKEHIVLICSAFIWSYYGFLFLNFHFFHISSVGLSVVQELITIPLTILHLVLLIIAGIWWMEQPKLNRLIFWNGLLLLLSNGFLINQLFFN
jgi:hypothetical protein